MKIENSIGWCDETTNAVTGCDKVSPGCAHCYAQVGTRARVLRAQGIETWGAKGVRHPVAQFAQKLRLLNKKCVCDRCHEGVPFSQIGKTHECSAEIRQGNDRRGNKTDISNPDSFAEHSSAFGTFRRIRLFADSNSDWLDRKWELATLALALNEIRLAPNVDVLLLTKRIEGFEERLDAVIKWIEATDCKDADGNSTLGLRNWLADWMLLRHAPANVWLGVSVENQRYADERIPLLLRTPAVVRFISAEPLLGPIHLNLSLQLAGTWPTRKACPSLNWVIVGGESGKDRRDCGVEAIVTVAEQCRAACVPVYVKQDCAFKSGEQGRIPAEIWKLKQFPVISHRGTEAQRCGPHGQLNEESRKA